MADSAGNALALLRHNGPFRTLSTARMVSYLGDSVSLVALMIYVADTVGQAIAIAVLLLVGDFAPSLLSPIAGAISDRFDRRRVMIICELVQCGLLLAIALALPPLPLLLALVAARAITGQVFQPASRAVVPTLVRERDLPTANSTIGFGTNVAEAIGPLIAAGLFPLIGIRGVLLIDAASFLLSALLLLRLPALPPDDRTHAPPGSLLTDARIGLGYIWRTRTLRVIAIGSFAVVACTGIDDVALILLAKDTLQAGDLAVGLLLGAVGVGLLAGYLLLSRIGHRVAMPVLLIIGCGLSSVGNLLTGLAWAVAAAVALQAIRGLGIAASDVASTTLIQARTPARLLGRVFGNLYGLIGIAAALSYVGGGLLIDATSPSTTLVLAGGLGAAASIMTGWRLHRAYRAESAADRAPTSDPESAPEP